MSNVSWPKIQANSKHFVTELISLSSHFQIRDFESFDSLKTLNLLKYAGGWQNILREKNNYFPLLLTNTTWKLDLNSNALALHGHIPFPGLADEVVWEAFWLGEITLLNGDVKSNVVSWKFPASTWEWSSWKSHRAGSTSLLRNICNSPTEPSVITVLTLLLQQGKISFMQACCCNLGYL